MPSIFSKQIIKFCSQNDDKVKNITGEDLKIFRYKLRLSMLIINIYPSCN